MSNDETAAARITATARDALRAAEEWAAGQASAVDMIETISVAATSMNDHLGVVVAEARAAGSSWVEIAGALKVSRQAVQKRFGDISRDVLDQRI